MKIGIDVRCFVGNRTGVANNVYMLLNELMQIRSHDTIYLYSSKDFDSPILNDRIVKRVGKTIFAKSGVFWLYTECKQTVISDGIDVFWGPGGMVPKFGHQIKTVLTINDFVWKKSPSTMPLLHRLALSLLSGSSVSNASRIFTISDAVAVELDKYMSRFPDAVIRPAVGSNFYRREAPEIDAVRRKYDITIPYYLIVGTLEPRKNVEVFIRAYRDILNTLVANVPYRRLVIVGGKGWKDSEIVRLINDAEQKGWLQRLGYVEDEDLPALYSGADVFFMPSRYEGFGMPVLEARYCGTPLVVADVPAMHEAGGDVALYHSPTYEGIYDVLERILIRKEKPPVPNIDSVSWSWRSGAEQLSKLIDDLSL